VIKLNDCCDTPWCQGTSLKTYGFGLTAAGGSTSSVLKTLDTQYQSLTSTNTYIAVKASDTTGICQGDSGGPLVSGDTQVGVASFVVGSCANGEYDGFARVSTGYGWIKDAVCDISSNPGSNFNCGAVAAAWYETRQGIANGVDSLSQMVGINLRGELGQVAGSLFGLSDNNDSN
jgi:secreted trypsin-like serine protease